MFLELAGESLSHPVMSRCASDLSLFAAQLASLPEAMQEEDKPAAEDTDEQQGEGRQSGRQVYECKHLSIDSMHCCGCGARDQVIEIILTVTSLQAQAGK